MNDASHAPAHWELTKDESYAKCRVFEVRKQHFIHPSQKAAGDFFVLSSPDWVNVVPFTDKGEIILVRQFRFGLRDLSWEVPGGMMEPGEDPVKTALRELEEETGWQAQTGKLLASCSPNPAILNNRCFFVLALDLKFHGKTAWDEHEELQTHIFSEEAVMGMVLRQEIRHSLALNALMYFRAWREGKLLV
jgi:ADP-ribose pyrophosphatase